MERENWINEVLESAKGIQKAEPSPFLFEQVTARINKGEFNSGNIDPILKWGLSAFVGIICIINVVSIVVNKESTTKESFKETLEENYFNNTTTYNY